MVAARRANHSATEAGPLRTAKALGTRVRVVCGIIERDGRFAAARRASHMSRGGLWEFPGGKVEPGERPAAALIRELREELGVTVTVGARLSPSIHEYHDIRIELIPFRCRITRGELRPVEHEEIRWVEAATARRLKWAPADVPILEEYLRTGVPRASS